MNKEEAIKQLKKHKQEIDKQYISSRYSKAIEVVLNLIQKQETELKEKEKHIEQVNEMFIKSRKEVDKLKETLNDRAYVKQTADSISFTMPSKLAKASMKVLEEGE